MQFVGVGLGSTFRGGGRRGLGTNMMHPTCGEVFEVDFFLLGVCIQGAYVFWSGLVRLSECE